MTEMILGVHALNLIWPMTLWEQKKHTEKEYMWWWNEIMLPQWSDAKVIAITTSSHQCDYQGPPATTRDHHQPSLATSDHQQPPQLPVTTSRPPATTQGPPQTTSNHHWPPVTTSANSGHQRHQRLGTDIAQILTLSLQDFSPRTMSG